uniref:Uncharacterized protein n=1 Tax=Morchella brunnea TaxID=1174671 RepID=A0A8K1MH69_9PEZI|nr:hypothetical protein LK370_mgp231 [Morchella brunnea]UBU98356.1 hypothetical protein [Morchella brunnea]
MHILRTRNHEAAPAHFLCFFGDGRRRYSLPPPPFGVEEEQGSSGGVRGGPVEGGCHRARATANNNNSPAGLGCLQSCHLVGVYAGKIREDSILGGSRLAVFSVGRPAGSNVHIHHISVCNRSRHRVDT